MKDGLVLIVDDMEINREILEEILEDEYKIICAEDGRKAIELIEEHKDRLSVILLDIIMPEVDGYHVLDYMKEHGYIGKIPVLVISGENSIKIEKKCFEMGASDFIRKPFDSTLVHRRVDNVAELYDYKKGLEEKIAHQTDTLKRQYKMLQKQAGELQKKNENIIDILGTVVECRDMESGEHIQRVKGYTEILANEMMKDYPEYGLTPKKIEIIVSASALHDIGKIAIPDNILLKPGKLTKEEYEYMKSHTTRGCLILKNIRGAWDDEYGKCSYEICRHHHERYDGKGYPDGLSGDEIPISAQLVSVADVYDALVNERVYKDAYSKEQAFQMIIQGECGVFSPKLLEAFRRARAEFEALTDAQKDAAAVSDKHK
jgi:putative two-component system response regulator